MRFRTFLALVGLMLILFSYSLAQVPQMINYQGKLTKASGAVLDTTVQMVFSIYAFEDGTGLKWTETQGAVKVEKGIFNVLLGSTSLIPDTVFDGSIRYLGVKVGADPEITPRKPMVSVPYAYRAGNAGDGGNINCHDCDTVFALIGHNHDPQYVNEAQANSISSSMITDGEIADADVSASANITPSKISGTAWTSTNDGAGSGLDADLLDGQQGTYYTNATNINAGTLADARLSTNVALLNNAQTFSGLKAFNPSSGTVPFTVDATKNSTVTNLNADLLDGQHATYFVSGSGTANYIPKFTGSSALGNSVIYETASKIGIGTPSPNEQVEITGNLRLPTTTSTAGMIKIGTDRFVHAYGSSNTFIGQGAGNLTMTGANNTATGYQALYSNSTGYGNTADGYWALYWNTTGYYNTANGYRALYSNTTGYGNTGNGWRTLYYNTEGIFNTATGSGALYSNTTGNTNTAIGCQALNQNTLGDSNTATGYGALYWNTTGNYNTANGYQALYSNTTGNYNTALGYNADVSANNLTNASAIGANAVVAVSNALVLGGTGANAVKVGIGTTSPQGALDVVSTTGALIVPRMTTAQRDALTAVNGMIIYNTSDNQFNFRENGAWVTK